MLMKHAIVLPAGDIGRIGTVYVPSAYRPDGDGADPYGRMSVKKLPPEATAVSMSPKITARSKSPGLAALAPAAPTSPSPKIWVMSLLPRSLTDFVPPVLAAAKSGVDPRVVAHRPQVFDQLVDVLFVMPGIRHEQFPHGHPLANFSALVCGGPGTSTCRIE